MKTPAEQLTELVFSEAAALVKRLSTTQIDGRSLPRAKVLSMLSVYLNSETQEQSDNEIPS